MLATRLPLLAIWLLTSELGKVYDDDGDDRFEVDGFEVEVNWDCFVSC